jgi:serine/threonine protein kinase
MSADAKRVQAVFLAAVEATDPAQQAALLDRECAADPELRRRVEALLLAHRDPASILNRPALPPLPAKRGSTAGDPDCAPGGSVSATVGKAGKAMCPDGLTATGNAVDLGFLEPSTRPGSLGRLGHYEVLEVIGYGGFGIVLRAQDETLQRAVAVKVLAPALAVTSPARKRFLREARSYAAIRHENVVQVHAVEELPLPYLVMEFVPGGTLQQMLDRTGPLDLPDVLNIGRQIAEGLAAAHGTGLIHRDVKPSNVLIEGGPQQRIKLTDFGLARAADDATISGSGLVVGTPLYMAPEQARGQALDHRADLFSLGSVLYVMCTGRPPFRADGALAILKRVCEDTPRPIREIIPETPLWLCDLIGRVHAKNPDERVQSAGEVAKLLAAHQGDPEAVPFARRSPIRRRGLAITVGFSLALIGVLALMVPRWWPPRSPGDGPRPDSPEKKTELPSQFVEVKNAEPARLPQPGRTSWFAQDRDGKWLAVPCENDVVLFDAGTLTPRKVLPAATDRVYQVDFSPDGKLLAVGAWSDFESVSIWDMHTGTLRNKLPHDGNCRFVQFSPDGTKLLTVNKDHVPVLWDAQSGAALASFPPQVQPLCSDMTFTADGKQIVMHGHGGEVAVWGWQDAKWDVAKKLPGPEQVPEDGIDWVHFPLVTSRDGKWLAAGSPSKFTVWDTTTWMQVFSKKTPASWLAFAPDGLTILSAAHEHADDRLHRVARWRTETGEQVKAASLGSRGPWAVYHLSLDGKRLYGMTCDPAEPCIHVYDAASFEERFMPGTGSTKNKGQ